MVFTSRLVTGLTSIVVVVAITLGSTAKFAPHLFFLVPQIGFILYAVTGGHPIPPFIIKDPFEEDSRGWLKEDDVVVSVGAKSGTTWMLFCSHQIRVKGDDETYPFVDVSLSTPWPGLIQTPGDNWDATREKMNTTILPDGTKLKDYWDHSDYPFRIFKSHDLAETYGDLIGKDNSIKILAMARNGLDVASSLVPFFDNHSDEIRRLWGNFPPAASGTMEEEAAIRIKQLQPGGMFESMYFDYVNSWWKVRKAKNVLLLHYSDAKKDLSGTVKRISDFYGVKLSSKEHKKVVEKCDFSYMKKHASMFDYQLPLNPKFKGRFMKSGKMIRKGILGDGKATFTDEDREQWRKVEEEVFGDDPEKLRWAREGGKF